MKVLYLSYDGLTDPLGQSQVLPYILGLCNEGHSFEIISFEKPGIFEKEEETILKIINGFPVKWYPQVYHKKPPILSTIIDLSKMWKVTKKLKTENEFHLVHCRSYLAGLIGLKLKKKFGTRFLFDIRGFWADERVDGGLWPLSNLIYSRIYRWFKRKEIALMHGADHIISLTYAGKDEIVSGNLFRGKGPGLSPNKITVIPCAVDLELFDPSKIRLEEQVALRKELNLDNADHVLVYLGSIGTWYLLDEMLEYFRNFQIEHPNSYFLFLTKEDPDQIINVAKAKGIDRDLIRVKASSRQRVPLHLSITTLGIFFIKPAYSKKASSATKMGEMMSMGLSVICNLIGDIKIIPYQSVKSHDEKMKIVEISCAGDEILKEYDISTGIKRYSGVYSQLG